MTEQNPGNNPREVGKNRLVRARGFAGRHWSSLLTGTIGTAWTVSEVTADHPLFGGGVALVNSLLVLNEISRENEKIDRRRTGVEVFGRKSTRGFRIAQHNEGADLLEATVGLTFPDAKRPQVVELEGRNKLLYAVREPTAAHMQSTGIALYSTEYNTIFNKGDKDIPSLLYGSMKSYINAKNPAFIDNERLYQQTYKTIRSGKEPQLDAERYTVMSCVSDGLADWAREFTLFNRIEQMWDRGEDFTTIAPEKTVSDILVYAATKDFEDTEGPYVPPYEKMDEHIASLDRVLSAKGHRLSRWRQLGSLLMEQTEFSSDVGLHFVVQALNELNVVSNDAGNPLSLPAALDVIITDPPLTTAEIKDPRSYARSAFEHITDQ